MTIHGERAHAARLRRGAGDHGGNDARGIAGRPSRVIVAAVLTAAAVLLVAQLNVMRSVEASLLPVWLDSLLPGGVRSEGPYFITRPATPDGQAFHLTPECSIVVLLAPLLVVAAAIMVSGRVGAARMMAAVFAMTTIMVIVNQLRLGLIAWVTRTWGMDPGYEISHRYLGSIVGIAGFAGGLAILLLIAGRRRRDR